jgi:uncharacterized protein YegL
MADNKNKLVVALLLDESGSMSGVKSAALSAVNEYIQSLKKDYETKPELGEIYLSLITFSDNYKRGDNVRFIYNLRNITEVSELKDDQYSPDGGTPLLEAIGKTIESLDAVEARNPSNAGHPLAGFLTDDDGECKIMMVVQTDGEENGWNKEYTKDKVQEMISAREGKGNWTVLFLGAGIDAIQEGMKVGMATGSSYSFKGTAKGAGSYGATYSAVTGASLNLRAAGGASMRVANIADVVSKLATEQEEEEII